MINSSQQIERSVIVKLSCFSVKFVYNLRNLFDKINETFMIKKLYSFNVFFQKVLYLDTDQEVCIAMIVTVLIIIQICLMYCEMNILNIILHLFEIFGLWGHFFISSRTLWFIGHFFTKIQI